MKTFLRKLSTFAVASVVFCMGAVSVRADGVQPTATPAPTATPEVRVVCENNAYGQQTCRNITVEREASPEPHKPVNSGIQENVMLAVIIGFAMSAFAYNYSRKE